MPDTRGRKLLWCRGQCSSCCQWHCLGRGSILFLHFCQKVQPSFVRNVFGVLVGSRKKISGKSSREKTFSAKISKEVKFGLKSLLLRITRLLLNLRTRAGSAAALDSSISLLSLFRARDLRFYHVCGKTTFSKNSCSIALPSSDGCVPVYVKVSESSDSSVSRGWLSAQP